MDTCTRVLAYLISVVFPCTVGTAEWQVHGSQDHCVVRGPEVAPGLPSGQQDLRGSRCSAAV